MLEKEVLSKVKNILDNCKRRGDIIWWERLQSGTVYTGGTYIRLCEKGTWDIVIALINKSKTLTMIFIEAKRSDGSNGLSPDQIIFRDKHKGEYIKFLQILDPNELSKAIEYVGYDRLKDINWEPS